MADWMHHIDGNPLNNDPANLTTGPLGVALMTISGVSATAIPWSSFCATIMCPRTPEGSIWIYDVAGQAKHGDYCRDCALGERDRLSTKHRSSLITIVWGKCQKCHGEGSEESAECGGCLDLTDFGGPFHFGDFLHRGRDVALYVAEIRPDIAWLTMLVDAGGDGSTRLVRASSVDTWARCNFGSPCNHPTTPFLYPF